MHVPIDLLSPPECAEIREEFLRTAPGRVRIPGRAHGGESWLTDGRDLRTVQQASRRLTSAIHTEWEMELVLETAYLSELGPGAHHIPHADAWKVQAGQWVPNHTPDRVAAATIFLREVEDGGELCFIDGAVYRPRVGLAVVFPSGHEHIHWTRPVHGAETRITLNLWFLPQADI